MLPMPYQFTNYWILALYVIFGGPSFLFMEKKCNFWSSESIAQRVFLNHVSLCNAMYASQKAPFEQGSIKKRTWKQPGSM